MKTLVPVLLLGVGAWAGAQQLPYAADAAFTVDASADGADATYTASISGASGKWWLYMATLAEAGDEDATWVAIGAYKLDEEGADTVSIGLDGELLASLPPITLRGVFKSKGEFVQAPAVTVGGGLPVFGDCVEFEWGLQAPPIEVGEIVTQTQPWAGIFTVGAQSTDPTGPDELVVFDSANPTGGDEDLMTPGFGVGNDTAFGHVLVIPEDLDDADNDGLVDEPNDEAFGGLTLFEFAGATDVVSLDILDIDDAGGEVRYYRGADLVKTVTLDVLGDNSRQTVEGARGVTRLEVEGGESRALAKLKVFPCRAVIDFDETTTGVPLDLPAGLDLGDAAPFAGLGLSISAQNNFPQKPQKAIVFDTGDVSGDDDDLMTPGPGPGNDVALGNAVIIAENDVDADDDGLVDEPDDELAGGEIAFDFAIPVRFASITVLDVDENESSRVEVDLTNGDTVVLPLAALGDNSAQTLDGDIGPTQRIRVVLGGSGAVPELVVCPQPPEDEPASLTAGTSDLKGGVKDAVKKKKRKRAKKKAKKFDLALK